MLGLKVTVPVACFRKGFAREFWETEELPPPATCYGFLLSLVGKRRPPPPHRRPDLSRCFSVRRSGASSCGRSGG